MIINASIYNSHWSEKTLSDLGTFKRGKSKHRPRNDPKLFSNGKYPLVQTGEVKSANLYINQHSATYNDFGLKQSQLWPKDTLCITIAANIAETALLHYPMCFPDSVVGFNAFPDASSELFMHYVFTYIRKIIQNSASGSIQDNINIDYLTSLKFKVPPKSYQDKISAVLANLDKKIELNNRINAELEAMAKTLYDYWFVQFDFPDATGKPYKTSGGKMVYNPTLKREIPDGWSAVSLFDAMDVQYGFPFDTSKFIDNPSGYAVARIRDVLENTISCYTTEEVDQKFLLKPNDLLVGMDGNFHVNFWSKSGVYLNQRTVRIREKTNSLISVFQSYFEISPYIKAREKNVSKTTVGHLSDKDLKRLYLLCPNSSEPFNPKKLFDPLLNRMMLNRLQNETLSSLRDWLLPMLMNGQVTVK